MASAKRWGGIGVAVEDIGEDLKEIEKEVIARDRCKANIVNQWDPTFRCPGR